MVFLYKTRIFPFDTGRGTELKNQMGSHEKLELWSKPKTSDGNLMAQIFKAVFFKGILYRNILWCRGAIFKIPLEGDF